MNNLKKITFLLTTSLIIVGFLLTVNLVIADQGDYGVNATAEGIGSTILQEIGSLETIAYLAGKIIRPILGIVGVVMFVLVLYGGIIWLIAAGNEEQIGRAKKIITNSVIGLAFTVFAYLIVYFILSYLPVSTTAIQ